MTKKIRFSEYFNLDKFQGELDFVNIFINNDIPLFLDPYVFKIRTDEWSVECNNLIVDFLILLLGRSEVVNLDMLEGCLSYEVNRKKHTSE